MIFFLPLVFIIGVIVVLLFVPARRRFLGDRWASWERRSDQLESERDFAADAEDADDFDPTSRT